MKHFRLFMLGAVASLALAATAARADIIVGVAGPVTGSEAAFGEQFTHGAQKAIEDINKKGGLLGQKLVFKSGDDACDPKQAVSVANDMVSAGAAVVIGHFCSGSSIPASDVYAEADIIQISPGSTNPDYTERGLANTFRVCGRDDAQGPIAAEYIESHFKGKNIAIVQDKSTYGQGLADQFKGKLNKLGVKEVLYDSITAGDQDFSALVSKLKQAKVDVLYFGGYKTEAGLIARQLREQGLKTIIVGGDALVTDEYWAITGPAGAGTLMTFGPDPRLNPANKKLVEEFRATKYEPEAYTLYTYAAIQAWADAVAKAGTTNAAKVEAILKKDKFETVLGELQFDAKGDNKAPGYVMYEWQDAKYGYVKK